MRTDVAEAGVVERQVPHVETDGLRAVQGLARAAASGPRRSPSDAQIREGHQRGRAGVPPAPITTAGAPERSPIPPSTSAPPDPVDVGAVPPASRRPMRTSVVRRPDRDGRGRCVRSRTRAPPPSRASSPTADPTRARDPTPDPANCRRCTRSARTSSRSTRAHDRAARCRAGDFECAIGLPRTAAFLPSRADTSITSTVENAALLVQFDVRELLFVATGEERRAFLSIVTKYRKSPGAGFSTARSA